MKQPESAVPLHNSIIVRLTSHKELEDLPTDV